VKHERKLVWFVSFILLMASFSMAATTGKVAGTVTDKETGEPLAGANIVIVGTNYGAAADAQGDYFIINVPPGKYTVKAMMMGYGPMQYKDVKVSINSTVTLDFQLTSKVIEGEVVTVSASAISFKKDQTSSIRNVSSDQMDVLPIENVQDVIDMQAGVVNGHFRGGRRDEVSYLVDGIQVDNSFDGVGGMVDVESDVIEDLEIITGTFNAEYGRAMSGIVNAVTKDGGDKLHGRVTGYLGNYYTAHDELFIGLKPSEVYRNQDYQIQLEGPIISEKLNYFVNVRYQNNGNHLNAIRRFLMNDYSDYSSDNPANWIDTHRGDSSYVPLNDAVYRSLFGKLTYRPNANIKLSLLYSGEDDDWGNYSHTYKYAPDGKARGHKENSMASFQLNHSVSSRLFYELKVSYVDNYYGRYLYENPLDDRYIHDRYHNAAGPGFFTGGQDKGHTRRGVRDWTYKYDLTWQLHKNHSLKTGVQYISHDIHNRHHQIQNKYRNKPEEYDNYYDEEKGTYIYPNFEPELLGDETIYGEVYHVYPKELSAYFQDKMEFNEMVINFGLRYDSFNPDTKYPTNWRNPANQLNFENENFMSDYTDADTKQQLSPRFGLSYQLSDAALLHFSYGHFFQAPPYYAFFQNHSFLVQPTDYVTETGNPQLEAQRTVQYEIGLWQEIIKGMGLEVNLYYRDIYDLLSMRIMTTYNQIRYGLYTNKDYGNVKGLELKYDLSYGHFNAYMNYTLQYTRGNADDPTQTFNRAGDNKDPISRLIPLSWDQRHTFNLSLNYAKKNYSATVSGYVDSGTPYTWSPIEESRLSRVNLYPNNSKKPMQVTFDFYGYYDIDLADPYKVRLNLKVENLFDRRNELWVNPTTGHANEAIIRDVDLANHRSLFNEYEDRIINPAAISAPRYVKFGVSFIF